MQRHICYGAKVTGCVWFDTTHENGRRRRITAYGMVGMVQGPYQLEYTWSIRRFFRKHTEIERNVPTTLQSSTYVPRALGIPQTRFPHQLCKPQASFPCRLCCRQTVGWHRKHAMRSYLAQLAAEIREQHAKRHEFLRLESCGAGTGPLNSTTQRLACKHLASHPGTQQGPIAGRPRAICH